MAHTGESHVKRLPGTAPALPLGSELSEQLGRNPLHFSDPWGAPPGIHFLHCLMVVNFESSASLLIGTVSIYAPWPSKVLVHVPPARSCVTSCISVPVLLSFPIRLFSSGTSPCQVRTVGPTQCGGKRSREKCMKCSFPQGCWNGWRSELFACERNTSSDSPELNSRSIPEVGGQRRKGLECSLAGVLTRQEGCRPPQLQVCCGLGLRGKISQGCWISRASPSSSLQCTWSASVPKGLEGQTVWSGGEWGEGKRAFLIQRGRGALLSAYVAGTQACLARSSGFSKEAGNLAFCMKSGSSCDTV